MSAASGIIQILTQPSTLPSPFDVIVKVANAAAVAISTGILLLALPQAQEVVLVVVVVSLLLRHLTEQ